MTIIPMPTEDESVRSKTENAVEEIKASWQKSINSMIETAQLILEYSFSSEWKNIQKELADRNIMKPSVVSMMLGIANNPVLTNPEYRDKLPLSYNSLYHLSLLEEKEVETRIKDGKINTSFRLEDVRALKKKLEGKPATTTVKNITLASIPLADFEENKIEILVELEKLKEKYPCIVVKAS